MEFLIPLNECERSILENLYQSSLPATSRPIFSTASLVQETIDAGFEKDEIAENIECLIDRGHVTGRHGYQRSLPETLQLTESGFRLAIDEFLKDYDEVQEAIAKYLTNAPLQRGLSVKNVADELGRPFLITWHFIDSFSSFGWLTYASQLGPQAYITYVSPLLKRALEVNANVR